MSDDGVESLRKLAEAGAQVLGSDEQIAALFEHHCRNGTWLFVGAAVAAIASVYIAPGWTVGIALLVGWAVNEREQRRIRRRLAGRDQTQL